MTRRYFIGLLSSFFGCANEEIKPKKMKRQVIDWWVGGASGTADTTADGKQVFLVIGDSKCAWSGDTDQASPSPTSGTAYQWDHVTTNSVIALTSTDLVNAGFAGANRGSPWPQFCIDYNALSGKKAVIVDGHKYGSFWNSATASFSWDIANSTLYPLAKSRADACLASLSLTKLKGIFITLGINDNGSAVAINTVTAAMQTLVDQLQTDYGTNIPIYISQMGYDNSSPTARTGAIKNAISDLAVNNTMVFEDTNEASLYGWGEYHTDITHWKQAGNNSMGKLRARFVYNANAYTDKDVRRIVYGYHYDAINSTKAAGWATFIANQKASGNWSIMDMLYVFKQDTQNNIVDFRGRSGQHPSTGYTFNANANISTDGVSTYFNTRYNPTALAKNATQNDMLWMYGSGNVTTAAGTAAAAFGSSAGSGIYLAQDASSRTAFIFEQATPQTYTTDTKIQNDIHYALRRTSSTNMELIKDGTIVSTKSVSSTGLSSINALVGARNNSNPNTPTTSTYMNATHRYLGSARASGFDLSSFNTDIAALLTALS